MIHLCMLIKKNFYTSEMTDVTKQGRKNNIAQWHHSIIIHPNTDIKSSRLTSDRSPLSCWESCLRLSVDDSGLQTHTHNLVLQWTKHALQTYRINSVRTDRIKQQAACSMQIWGFVFGWTLLLFLYVLWYIYIKKLHEVIAFD